MSSNFSVLDFLINSARTLTSRAITGASSGFDNEMLINILQHVTLPVFSIYIPNIEIIKVTLDDLVPGTSNRYIIRSENEIISIKELIDTSFSTNGIYAINPSLAQYDIVESQFIDNVLSASALDLTWEFYPPNIVDIFPNVVQHMGFFFKVKTFHPIHCNTIHKGSTMILRDLFLCDVAESRLSELKFFRSISSPYGDIELNLDALEAQAQKKDEVIAKLREMYAHSAKSTKVVIR